MQEHKPRLRLLARERVRELTPAAKADASATICERLLHRVGAAANVLAFWPLPSEPDLRPLLLRLREGGTNVCLPRVTGDVMSPHSVPDLEHLVRSRLGVHEPDPGKSGPFPAADLDLVIVPGVAFTTGGARMGRGGGYYDRLLAGLPDHTVTIGVAFRCQIFEDLPLEAHDVPVGEVVVA